MRICYVWESVKQSTVRVLPLRMKKMIILNGLYVATLFVYLLEFD